MKKSPIIALLTDFGYSDGYVGSMKGVIHDIAPQARIVDITHNIPPQHFESAAYILWSSYRFFPRGTIFISVVDPGVGSKRKILGVKTKDYIFLSPDNGLLKYIFATEKKTDVISLVNKKYFLSHISSTFHGRDILAPVAAHLANRISLSTLGKKTIPVTTAEQFVYVNQRGEYSGKIIHIDHFGNIVTNFQMHSYSSMKLTLYVRKHIIQKYYSTYSESTGSSPFLIVGSSGLIEISIFNGNAASLLKLKPSQSLRLKRE
jgi:hypothetical protein